MAWVVYHNTSRVVHSGHPNSAFALGVANSLGSSYTRGRVNDSSGNETTLPAGFQPGYWIRKSDGQLETIDSQQVVIANADANTLKVAARTQRERLLDLRDLLEQEKGYYPPEDVKLAEAFLSWIHWGSRGVFMSTSLTVADKLQWVSQSGNGPNDLPVSEIENFFPIVHNWTADQKNFEHEDSRAPDGPVLVCSPTSPYARWDLADLRTNSDSLTNLAPAPTSVSEIRKISTGGWIDDITV